ncbi:MAG: hypothetical protein IPO31_24825 [Candidatus Obscuribacter sp.]|nr:hypothetical protein [Candidatus Obscuribacter sp.]
MSQSAEHGISAQSISSVDTSEMTVGEPLRKNSEQSEAIECRRDPLHACKLRRSITGGGATSQPSLIPGASALLNVP